MTDNTPTNGNRSNTRLASHVTGSTFIHAEDALAIGKLKFYAGEYVAGQGAKAQLAHYLDLPEAWLWMTDMSTGEIGAPYTDTKGYTDKGTGEVRSRVLRLGRGKDKQNRAEIIMQLEDCPGTTTPTGAVIPTGPAETKVRVSFTVHQARSFALVCLAYLQADAVLRLAAERKKAQ